MNNDELLETYLDALRKDPHTPVPAGLDPDLAAFARTLYTAYPAESGMSTALQKRIWERALSAAMHTQTELSVPSANGRHHSDSEPNRRDSMIHPTLMKRPALAHPGLLTGTAALLVILIAGALTLSSLGSNKPGGTNTIGLQAPTETGTSTLIPTSTPLRRLVEVTATPIPFQPTVPPPSFEDATPAVLPFLIEGRLAADKPYHAYKFTATESGVVRLLAISKSFQPTLEFTISGSAGQGGGGGGGGGSSDPNAPVFVPVEQFLMVNAGMEVVVALSGGEGDFTLSATFSTIGEIRYDVPLSVQMSPDQTFAYVAFKGTAGTVLTVEVGKTEGVDLMLDLAEVVQVLPMAAQVSSPFQVSDDDGGSGVSPEIFQVTLPRTTTYVVIVKLKHPTDSADILLAVLTVRGQ